MRKTRKELSKMSQDAIKEALIAERGRMKLMLSIAIGSDGNFCWDVNPVGTKEQILKESVDRQKEYIDLIKEYRHEKK